MKKAVLILLVMLFTSVCFSQSVDVYLDIVPESFSFEFFSTKDLSRVYTFSPVFSNLIEVIGYQNILSDSYFISVNSEVYPSKLSLFVPVGINFENLLSILSNSFGIEDVSKEGRKVKRLKELNIYVSEEKGGYVGVSDSVDVLVRRKLSSLNSDITNSFRSVVLKGISEGYPYFSYVYLRKVSEIFSFGISNIAKYNFIEDFDFLEIYSEDNRSYQGKLYLRSKSKMRLVYIPKVIRNVNIEFLPKRDNLVSFSVSPNFVVDLINSFYPDISQISPSLISDLSKTISGTFVASFSLDNLDRVKRDFVFLVGVKSKSQADRFLKSFLGLSKYKRVRVGEYQLYEIAVNIEGREEKFYITYTDKEYVITLSSEVMVSFLDNVKKNNKNYVLSRNFIPMIYLDVIVNRNLGNFIALLLLPKVGERVVLSVEPDESLNFINIYAE